MKRVMLSIMNFKLDDTSNLRQYQYYARQTAIYPNRDSNYIYPALGLCGESGEIAEKIKKIIRDKDGIITEETKADLEKELGDVLWYVANLACELKLDLQHIAKKNLEKLFDRLERNKIHGEGDDR